MHSRAIRKQRLPNGLTVITEAMPHVRSVSIGVWLRRGSRDEPEHVNGISHFIEHLVFKGTQKHTAREIALVMDSIGGQMDAFTSKEYTCFYAKVLDEHVAVAIDLLAEIVQRPLFDPTELERERQVVLEEIRMVEDTPDDLIYDLFSGAFYPRHPLGRPIQGTEQTVGGLTRRQLLRFFRGSYRPGNLLLVAAGNLRHAQLMRLVRRGFGGLEPGRAANGKVRRPRPCDTLVTRVRNELSQLHLLLGVPAFAESLERRYVLHVLNAVLGGTMSSRLFQKVREERGLAYAVFSSVSTFSDSGFLTVYAGTGPKKGSEVVRIVLDELRDLVRNGPREDELRVAKENLKGSLMLGLESTSSRMSNLARQEIYYERELTMEETLAGIDGVTVEQVRELAVELLAEQRVSLAAVGRVVELRVEPDGLRV